MSPESKREFFQRNILQWHFQNPRQLPWKNTDDPYKIWISEIILQQTRVDQGKKYYKKFIGAFPNLKSLADSNIDQVMKAWEGLGYYSRARNMHDTAKMIENHYDGIFPDERNELKKLKGIGSYTSAAIASFAFGRCVPVVDGNVIRVISRVFGVTSDVGKLNTIRHIENIAQKCICPDQHAEFNQGIMDFGSLVCTPRIPKCENCPMQTICLAYHRNSIDTIPYKKKSPQKKTRHFQYFIISQSNNLIVHKRTRNDIWQFLYELPLLEAEKVRKINIDELLQNIFRKIPAWKIIENTYSTRQTLSHQIILASFHQLELQNPIENIRINSPFLLLDHKNLCKFAFPKLIDCYLKDNLIYLKNKETDHGK